jgi:hypothetical protein
MNFSRLYLSTMSGTLEGYLKNRIQIQIFTIANSDLSLPSIAGSVAGSIQTGKRKDALPLLRFAVKVRKLAKPCHLWRHSTDVRPPLLSES